MKNRKASESNVTDKLCNLLLSVPFLPGTAVGFIRWLDKWGLLPKWIIDASPFHTSMFITNMASIRMGYVYHHIYDFGTTSVFISMGQKEAQVKLDKENNPVVKNVMPLGVVIDERICSGAEFSLAFSDFEDSMQYQCALNNNCDAIVTFNQSDYKYADQTLIKVFSPDEFLKAAL